MSETNIMEKAKKLGQLLALSPLADNLKEALIANVANLSADSLDRIIEALEAEQEFLDYLEKELRAYTVWQEDEWNKLAMLQSRVAEDLLNDEIKELDRQARIDDIKQSIT